MNNPSLPSVGYIIHKIAITITLALVLSGCSRSHLEIFPELEDPSLMNRLMSVKEMHEDIDAFITGAMERHPSLSNYADLNLLESAKQDIKNQITQPLNRVAFYQYIGQLTHILNDGHSLLIWPYQEYKQLMEAGHKSFPFEVVINKEGRMFFKQGYTSNSNKVAPGSEILSINDQPAKDLVEQMQQYASGESKYLREQSIASRIGISLWSSFGYIDQFDLVIRDEKQDVMALAVKANDDWEMMDAEHSNKNQDHYYKQLAQGVGYLYLDHFDIDPDKFEQFVDKSFAQIKADKIQSLIIDIRNNPGGNTDTVTYLTRYIADKKFRMVSSVREKLNHDNRGIFNYRGEVGEILLDEWDDWHQPIDSETHFKGDTYLLISPITYSAAIVLATSLQDNGFATLVGEPTGGFGNQTAQGNLFNLPNSQLRAYIATKTLVRPSGQVERDFVRPDHVAYNSLEDVKAQRDKGIDRILELIRNKQAK